MGFARKHSFDRNSFPPYKGSIIFNEILQNLLFKKERLAPFLVSCDSHPLALTHDLVYMEL